MPGDLGSKRGREGSSVSALSLLRDAKGTAETRGIWRSQKGKPKRQNEGTIAPRDVADATKKRPTAGLVVGRRLGLVTDE